MSGHAHRPNGEPRFDSDSRIMSTKEVIPGTILKHFPSHVWRRYPFFGKQTKKKVFLVEHQYLQGGVSSLRKKLIQLRESYEGYAVADAICDYDLHLIGKATHDFKLITGASGVAIGLPDNFKREGLLDNSALSAKLPFVKGPSVILAGSCSAATNLQVKEWLRYGAGLKLNPVDLLKGEQSIEDVLIWAQPYLKKGKAVLIYTTDTPDSVKAAQEKLGVEAAGNLVEETFSNIAVRLFESDILSFIVAGGETSGAVVKALGVKALRVGKQIDPGVPWMVSQSPPHIALALKSGNFGSPDFFIKNAGGAR